MTMKRQPEEITKEEILAEYVNKPGSNLRETAARLGFSYRGFSKALRYHGFEPRGIGKFRTAIPQMADIEWLKKELETKSIRQVAREIGTTSGNLCDFLKRRHVVASLPFGEAVRLGLRKTYLNKPHNGANHPNWKGGKVRRGGAQQYIMIHKPNHPNADNSGYVMEHRLIMEQHLDRYLQTGEYIHHINGDSYDNRPENLQLVSKKEHAQIHFNAVKEVSRLKAILEAHGIPY